MRRIGIEALSVLGMPPVEHVRLAADLGCVAISLGLRRLPVEAMGHPELGHLFAPWSLQDDPLLQRELLAALADTGIEIALGEGMRVDAAFDVHSLVPQLDLFARLGARRINAISAERDAARELDQFGQLADLVAERGMEFMVEFAPHNVIPDPARAKAIADALGHARCGMMLDAMHFFRAGGAIADIAALPIRYAQICDVPRLAPPGQSYFEEACFARRVPGDGELPLREWIAALPADCTIGIEVPDAAAFAAGLSPREHCARAVAATRALAA